MNLWDWDFRKREVIDDPRPKFYRNEERKLKKKVDEQVLDNCIRLAVEKLDKEILPDPVQPDNRPWVIKMVEKQIELGYEVAFMDRLQYIYYNWKHRGTNKSKKS